MTNPTKATTPSAARVRLASALLAARVRNGVSSEVGHELRQVGIRPVAAAHNVTGDLAALDLMTTLTTKGEQKRLWWAAAAGFPRIAYGLSRLGR